MWMPAGKSPAPETTPATNGSYGVVDARSSDDNSREFSYYLPVEGYPWTIVMLLPFESILAQAARAAQPLLLLLIPVSIAAAIAVPVAAQRRGS